MGDTPQGNHGKATYGLSAHSSWQHTPGRMRGPQQWQPHAPLWCLSGKRHKAGRKLLCGGGEVTRRPIFPTPSLLGRRDGRGGSGRGCPTCRAGGGGVNPTSMTQNDTHIALIILTTQMWGGGGDYWWKKLNRAKICVPAPSAPTSVLTQNKGPDTEPHFSNPPPSFGGRPCQPPPPPPPRQSNFQVA